MSTIEVMISDISYVLYLDTYTADIIDNTFFTGTTAIIPDYVEYLSQNYSVTSINDVGFSYCDTLTKVILGNNIKRIGDESFRNCNNLTEVIFGNGLEHLGFSSFNSTGLYSVSIPDSVTSINGATYNDAGLFNFCINLTFVKLPSNLTKIPSNMFYGCINFTEIVIPNSVTELGQTAFTYSGITSIGLHNNIKTLGQGCFSGTFIDHFIFPKLVEYIDESIFEGCFYLTSVTLNDNINSIGDRSFYNCIKLKSIDIPKSVTKIGVNAFDYCFELTSVIISDVAKITTIYNNSFYNSTIAGSSIKFPSILNYSSLPNSIWQTISTYFETVYYGISIFYDNLNITYSIDIIGALLKSSYDGIISPNSIIKTDIGVNVTEIGTEAFNYCNLMTKIAIPNSVTRIGTSSFESCSLLTSIAIPNSVIVIDDNAFFGCNNLLNVTIGNSVTRIGTSSFESCSLLTSIEIPNSVIVIDDNAFFGCNNLLNVTIGNSVTRIGISSFEECILLTSISIPNSVIVIDDNAFFGCNNLLNVTIGNSVTRIGISSFEECILLTYIAIPNSVIVIDDNAFFGCNNLLNVTIGNVSNIDVIYISSFTDVSNVLSTLTFNGIIDYTDLVSIWNNKNLYTQWNTITYYYQILNPNRPPQIPPTLSNFNISTKIYGEIPFIITQPTTNSDGSFTYISSNTSVATISENVITIIGVGNSNITAIQAETADFYSGNISASFEVINSSNNEGAPIYTPVAFEYILNTSAPYANIEVDLLFENNQNTKLKSDYKKNFISGKGMKRIKG